MPDPRVAEAFQRLEDEAAEARLTIVFETVREARERVAAGYLNFAMAAGDFERWAARLDVAIHPVAQELLGAATTARGIYLRAAGALRGRWCEVCGEPTEGERHRQNMPLCNASAAKKPEAA